MKHIIMVNPISGKKKGYKHAQIIQKLLKKNNGVIETYQVEDLGINNKVLTRMIERELIERVARGTYIGADTFEDALALAKIAVEA